MDVPCELGVWLDSAVRNVPRGTLSWQGIPRRIYTASIDARFPFATVRRAPATKLWAVSMPGFEGDVRGERGSATTRALHIERSPTRGFSSSDEAKRAVEEAYRALLAVSTLPSGALPGEPK